MPARARHTLRTLVLATGAAVASTVLALAAAIRLPPVQRWVAAQVSAQLGPDVHIDRAALAVLPAPGVRLSGVSVRRGGGTGATIDSVVCTLRPAPLLRGRLELAAVTIDSPTLSLARNPGGTIEANGPVGPLLGGGGPAPAREIRLPTVFVRNATVDFVGRSVGGDPVALHFHDVDLHLDPADAADVPFHLTAQVDPAGRIGARGTLRLGSEPSFEGTLQVDGAGCRELIAALSGRPSKYGCDSFSADVMLRGPVPVSERARRALLGSGRLEVRGGALPSSSVLEAIWRAAMPLVDPSRALAPLREPTRIVQLTQSFTLRAGRLSTDDLSLVTSDYTLTGAGSAGLDGSLDLDTKVTLTAAGAGKLLVMASLPIPSADLGHLPPIPTRITGTLANPQIRPHVSPAGLGALQRGATGMGKLLGGAAGAGGRALGQGLRALCPTCTEP